MTNFIAFCMEISDHTNKGGVVDVIYCDLARLFNCFLLYFCLEAEEV